LGLAVAVIIGEQPVDLDALDPALTGMEPQQRLDPDRRQIAAEGIAQHALVAATAMLAQEVRDVPPGARRDVVEEPIVMARDLQQRGVKGLMLGPGEPGRAVGAHPNLHESLAQRRVQRRDLIAAVLGVDRGHHRPALRESIVVQRTCGEELQGRILNETLGTVQLLEEEQALPVLGQGGRTGVVGAPVMEHRQPDQIRRLQQRQVEDAVLDPQGRGRRRDQLALADPGRPLEQDGLACRVGESQHRLDARPKRQDDPLLRFAGWFVHD
jgi:hypothetical protein